MEHEPQLSTLLTDCLADADSPDRRRVDDGWAHLIRRYEPLMRRVVHHTLKLGGVRVRPEDVDELVQEAFCRLFENRRGAWLRFRGEDEWIWRSYLTRIARNVAWDRVRRLVREERLRVTFRVRKRSPKASGEAVRGLRPWAEAEDAPTPEDLYLAREERLAFWRRALRAASPSRHLRRRNAWILHRVWVRGWTSREVSRSLSGELSPSSVDSVVSRARRGLGVGRVGRRYTPRPRAFRSTRRSTGRAGRLG